MPRVPEVAEVSGQTGPDERPARGAAPRGRRATPGGDPTAGGTRPGHCRGQCRPTTAPDETTGHRGGPRCAVLGRRRRQPARHRPTHRQLRLRADPPSRAHLDLRAVRQLGTLGDSPHNPRLLHDDSDLDAYVVRSRTLADRGRGVGHVAATRRPRRGRHRQRRSTGDQQRRLRRAAVRDPCS